MSRIFDIVQSMSGQKNVIVLPRPYLLFFKEDQQAHALAAVLNNLVFWSAFGGAMWCSPPLTATKKPGLWPLSQQNIF